MSGWLHAGAGVLWRRNPDCTTATAQVDPAVFDARLFNPGHAADILQRRTLSLSTTIDTEMQFKCTPLELVRAVLQKSQDTCLHELNESTTLFQLHVECMFAFLLECMNSTLVPSLAMNSSL